MDNNRLLFRLFITSTGEYYKYYSTEGLTTHLTPSDLYAAVVEVKGDYVIEQCTGLTDKNGTLIFEGDILEFREDESEFQSIIQPYLGKVVWIKQRVKFELQTIQEGVIINWLLGIKECESEFSPYDYGHLYWNLCEVVERMGGELNESVDLTTSL